MEEDRRINAGGIFAAVSFRHDSSGSKRQQRRFRRGVLLAEWSVHDAGGTELRGWRRHAPG